MAIYDNICNFVIDELLKIIDTFYIKTKKKSDGGNHRSMEGMQQKIYDFLFYFIGFIFLFGNRNKTSTAKYL